MPVQELIVKEGRGLIFEEGLFSRGYGTWSPRPHVCSVSSIADSSVPSGSHSDIPKSM